MQANMVFARAKGILLTPRAGSDPAAIFPKFDNFSYRTR